MIPGIILSLALVTSPGEGDVLFRLGRLFPDASGYVDGTWAGDQCSFLDRVRFSRGGFDMTAVAEKDPGEDWCDLVTAGASYQDPGSAFSAVGGWLKADLGSGLVLSHPGGWSSGAGIEEKPPSLRTGLEPAASPGCSDAEPLLGAGGGFYLGGMSCTLLGASSRIDPSGDGLHRTASELAAEGSVREDLAAARIAGGPIGFGAVLGDRGDGLFGRAGIDFDGSAGAIGITCEAAAGLSGNRASEAFWACMHEETSALRFNAGIFRCPGDFPGDRSSMPLGGTCDIGAGASAGLRPGDGWSARLTAMCLLEGDDSGSRADLEITRRMTPDFDLGLRARGSSEEGAGSFRIVATSSWRPAGGTILSAAVQRTGHDGPDGSPCGTGAETRLKLSLGDAVLRLAAAGFSTDDYDSRVYFGELSLPGDFASIQQYGSGFLLQAALGLPLSEGSEIAGRVSYLRKDSVESMVEGSEETEGASRLDATIQFRASIR